MNTNKNNIYFFRVLSALVVLLFSSISVHSQQKTYQWVRHLGGTNWDITGGAAIDTKNNIYVAGTFSDTLHCSSKKLVSAGSEDMFLARFDDKGNMKDNWRIGGRKANHATCLSVLPDGSVVIGGSITDTATFEKSTITGKGTRLFLACLTAKGRLAWTKEFYPKGNASLYLLGNSENGDIYAGGSFTDSIVIGDKTLASMGKNDAFIIKIASDGTIANAISFGSSDNEAPGSISVHTTGELTIAGNFTKSFGIGDITFTPAQNQKANTFLIRFDKNLQPQWGKHISALEYCHLSATKTDADGNLYIAGTFSSELSLSPSGARAGGLTDIFIAKYSPEGTLSWARNIGTGYYDYANHLNIDNLGGVMITGSIGDTLSVDSLTIAPPTEGNTAFVLQLSSEGKAVWGDYISGAGRDFSENAVLDASGNLYLYGSFRNYFQKEEEKIPSYGDQDIFLAKYFNCDDSKAKIQGITAICPGTGTELKVKSGFKNITWNDSIREKSLYVMQPGTYRVSMMDKKGCRFTDTIDIALAPLPLFSLGSDTNLFVGDSLVLHVPEAYSDYKWIDRFYAPEYKLTAPDGKPCKEICWLMVKDSLGCTYTDTITVTFSLQPGWIDLDNLKITVYPNPVIETLYWYIDTDSPCKLVMELTDSNGKVFKNQYIERYFPGQVEEMNLDGIPAGPYLIRVRNSTAGNSYKTVPVIKQ